MVVKSRNTEYNKISVQVFCNEIENEKTNSIQITKLDIKPYEESNIHSHNFYTIRF